MCFFRVCQLQVWILWRLKENDGIMILDIETQANNYLDELEHL